MDNFKGKHGLGERKHRGEIIANFLEKTKRSTL